MAPYESYIDKHQADYMGNFTANIRDMHEDYIRPQENGSHFGCRHMTVSDGRINLRFTAENDFSFNASEYTEEELAAKRHNFELQKCESNVICVDSQMAGVGSNSCGPASCGEIQTFAAQYFRKTAYGNTWLKNDLRISKNTPRYCRYRGVIICYNACL